MFGEYRALRRIGSDYWGAIFRPRIWLPGEICRVNLLTGPRQTARPLDLTQFRPPVVLQTPQSQVLRHVRNAS